MTLAQLYPSRCLALFVWAGWALAVACGGGPPPAERAPQSEAPPRAVVSQQETGTQRPNEDLLRYLAGRSSLVIVGRIASEAEGRGRFPESRDQETMRILEVEVEERLQGESEARITVVDPLERERFGAGARVILYLKEVDDRWFNVGGFAVGERSHIPELGFSLERVREMYGEPQGEPEP